jgi:hypothetical protein|tara:strand:- start:68 stop:301 length:234 start_codon:yes stop_codon:yes gene_type:complete
LSKKRNQGSGVPVLTGQALVAAVNAAEAPLLGDGVKQLFFKQLGLDRLMEVDFDLLDDAPDASIMAPVYPATEGGEA